VLGLQALAAEFGREEEAQQIVAEIRRALRDAPVEVLVEFVPAGLANFLVFGDAFERGVDELAEDFAVGERQVEHVRDHCGRNVLGVLIGGVDQVGVAHLVDEPVAERARLGFHRRNLRRGERGQEHATCMMMERRIGSDRRRAAIRAALPRRLDSFHDDVF